MKRQILLFIASLMALTGSAVALLASASQLEYALRGYVDATQDANLPYRIPRLGVNVALEQYDPTELRDQLDLMDQAHNVWLRQKISWAAVETEAGVFNWSSWDRIFTTLEDYPRLRIVAVLVNSPDWARPPQGGASPTTPPDNPGDFARFAGQFAARYGDYIDYYQIWDEPNILLGWGGLEPRPADYAALLSEAYPAIHAADLHATVIAAALAPTTETGPLNVSDILYLRDLYALGAKDYMDAAAAKPIGFNRSPLDRTVDPAVLNFSRIIALREVMVQNGDGQKTLWASEWGWNSLPTDWNGSPSIWENVSENERIEYTLLALERAEREWPWLGGMILSHWQPAAAPDDPLWGFAIIDADYQPTSLWAALKAHPALETATNGLFHPQTQFAAYSGVWTLSRIGADIGWLNDSQLTFRFQGTDVAILARKGDYVAYLYPSIDDKPPNAVPQDANGNGYIVLTSGDKSPGLQLIPIARNLSNTPHTLHLIADRGWDRWALAGFAVSTGNLALPYQRQFIITALTFATAVISVLVTGWSIRQVPLLRPVKTLWESINLTGQIAISAATSLALMLGMLITWGDGAPNIVRRDAVQLGLAVVTAGIIYLNPAFVVTIAALAALFFIVYQRIELGLMLSLFWTPFFLFPVELYRFAFPIAEIMILVTGAAWGLRMLRNWGQTRQSHVSQFPAPSLAQQLRALRPLDIAVGLWLLTGLVSLLWARWLPPAITELRALIFEPALFYVVIRTSHLSSRWLVRLVDTLLIAGVIVSLVGFWTYLNPALRITAEGGAQRLTSVYGSPNNVALFLGRCIPFALAFLLTRTDARRRQFMGIALAVMLVAVMLTQSVGGLFIGIPVSVAVTLLLAWRRKALLPLAALVILGLLAFGVALQFPRFARVLDIHQGTNFFRIRVWQSAAELISDYPLTGVGLDQFLYYYRGQYIRPDAEAEPDLSHPHNILLDWWVRLGLGGTALLVVMQFLFWERAIQAYRRFLAEQGLPFALTVGVMGSMSNLLAHGLVDNGVYVVDLALIFVFLLALAAAIPNIRAIDERNV